MRVLFTTGNAYFPQSSGGAQSSTHQLAMRLIAQGHQVAVLCKLYGGGWTEFNSRIQRRLTGNRFACDRRQGYPVYRSWDPGDASEVARRFRPDVAVVQHAQTMQIARSLQGEGVPVVLYFRNVEFGDLTGNPADLPNARYISNSHFTASRYRIAFGIQSTVIPPLIEPSHYRVKTTRENVTFINPYPAKGVDVALAVAERCPDIPFVFVESWSLEDEYRVEIQQRLANFSNVTLRSRTDDMKSVYGRARILLAPSKWEEAWGRVASEAHVSGIPVVGSQQGGLPEAIGDGGIALPYDAPTESWVQAVRRLWDDEDEYARLSAAALEFASRPEMDASRQLSMLLDVLYDAHASTGQSGDVPEAQVA